MKKLGDVFKISKGKKATETSIDTGLRYIQIGDLRNDDVIKFASNSTSNILCTKDDVLIAWDGANAGTVGYNLEGVIGSTLAKLTPKIKEVNSAFVGRFLQSKFTYLQENCTGATIPHLSRPILEGLQIPLPPLPQQQKIANILDATDELRKNNKALIAKYDDLTQALFLDMFGDPVSNPKGWKKASLKSVSTKITDGTHFSPEPQDKGFPYITAKHVKKHGLDFYSKPTYISEEAHNEIYKRCTPEYGDVLYIKDGATTGIACINTFNEPFSMLSSLALIKPNKKIINSYFLCNWLNNPKIKSKLLSEFMSGAAIQRYTLTKINSFKLVIPPIELQNQFEERVTLIEEQKAIAQKSLEKSEELFNSLLQKAFKGELA
ncbi:restriction endonuclease subunit S [Flavobacterium sp. F-65]|uniref:Restriction endonuclease subunit S n=1 Tax=Flavobacterium pisciphilum TaxID=2893755 RepID=A0ABS8MR90_9FLAO|nr:restriction endonuclease subunit S [Flavobacterium sp. F-65]MCC9071268.1 restriction endonuclease subunit S [Flavobacterium sp. F-65]